MASVDGYRDRTRRGNRRLQLVFASGLDVDVAAVSGTLVLRLVVTLLVFGPVRIRLLRVDSSVGLDVPEGVVHQTAVASAVTEPSRTIHQVLFAQGHELTGLAEVLTFQ
jgi:hypothetical protein